MAATFTVELPPPVAAPDVIVTEDGDGDLGYG